MKILYRYVFGGVLKNFTLSLGLFIFVVLLDRASSIAEMVLGQGVSFWDFSSVLLKGVPAFLGITVPMAFVLSVLIFFINMGSSNELTALKSCGIPVKKLSYPVFLLGFFLSLFSFLSLMFLTPASNVAMKKEIQELLKKRITLGITEKNFTSNFPGVTFYAQKVFPQKGYLENFMVSLKRKDKLITVFGSKGVLRTEGNNVFLDVQNGTAQLLNWKDLRDFKILKFSSYTVKLYTFSDSETFSAVKYKNLFELLNIKTLEAKVEMIKRFALSLSPLIVGIIAFSIGVMVPRGSVGFGVVTSLFLIVSYYVFYTISKKLALKFGLFYLPMLPDLIFGLLAYFLYKKAISETLLITIGERW